ncbi:Conserved_hypothetical protein [Hexamita inflata]|uniref:Uncharacterized protein n=1 Tax=Hexamita inflata TaxID=28002 RepID=A0AA86QDI9_9EUKA|nr:Conserved hypothetical protein [Hexamita inflata]
MSFKNTTFVFREKVHFDQRFTTRLNFNKQDQSCFYNDVGITVGNTECEREDEIQSRDQIITQFECDNVSLEPSTTNISLLKYFQIQQQFKRFKLDYVESDFDYTCQIISNSSAFYLELQTTQTGDIQCFYRAFHSSNENRTTLFGILCALKHIQDQNCSVQFLLQNNSVIRQFNFRIKNSSAKMPNMDLVMQILQHINKFSFKSKKHFDERFFIRLSLKSNLFFDHLSNTELFSIKDIKSIQSQIETIQEEPNLTKQFDYGNLSADQISVIHNELLELFQSQKGTI